MTESNPTMNNFTGEKSFNEIIKFISDSEFLFTNSFHGMYWAFLTGTTPIIFDIFSEKFLLARWKAEMLLPDQDPELVMMNARQFSNALHDSRTANLQFYQRFKHLISLPHLR